MRRVIAASVFVLAPVRGQPVYVTRVALFAVYALVSARFVLTSLSNAGSLESLAILGWLLLCAGLVARRSLEVLLASLVVTPAVSYIGLFGGVSGVAAAFLPFSCASLVWIVHRLVTRPRDLADPPWLAWLGDGLALVIVVKSAVALVTPSLQNALFRLLTLPSDYPYSEMQAMNVGFYLVSMLCLFSTLTVELRIEGPARGLASQRLRTALLLQLAVVVSGAAAQAVIGMPALTRDGLHAPFVGIHEMGFYAACWTAFFAVALLTGPEGGIRLRTLVPGLVAATTLLGASFSRTAWLAALGALLAWALFSRRRASRSLVAGAFIAAATAAVAIAALSRPPQGPDGPPPPRQRLELRQWASGLLNRERLSLFAKALVLTAERPLDGVGIGDYRITDDERTAALVGWMDPTSRRDHDAHNILLNLSSEAGLGSAALFLLLAAGAATAGIASGAAGQPIGHAAAAAVTAGTLCNFVNCVVTWPWQALTYGVLLALPLANTSTEAPLATDAGLDLTRREPARSPWPVVLPLLPAVVGLLLAPWSVRQDDALQRASYGFYRWEWFPPAPSFVACQASCRVQLSTATPVAAVRIRPVADLPRSGQLRLELKLNGVAVASQAIVPPQGIVVSAPQGRDSMTVELTTRHLWRVWTWGLRSSYVWLVELLDARGAILTPAGHGAPVDSGCFTSRAIKQILKATPSGPSRDACLHSGVAWQPPGCAPAVAEGLDDRHPVRPAFPRRWERIVTKRTKLRRQFVDTFRLSSGEGNHGR